MSDFRPDNMIPAPRDRHRSGRPGGTSQEPQLNLGNLDLPLDTPELNSGQPATSNNTVNETSLGGSGNIERPSGQKRSNKGYVFSRQRLIMGVAVLILIVVIMLLALTPHKPDNTADKSPSVAEKNIDLGALSGEQKTDTTANNPQFYSSQPDSNTSTPDQQQPLSPPPVASAPLQNNSVNASPPQQQTQLTLQGDLNNVLVPQQPANGHIAANEPAVTNNTQGKTTSTADKPAPHRSQPDALRHNVAEPKKTASKKAETSKSASDSHSAGSPVSRSLTLSSLKSAPTSYYTVQLSSGSSENNLRQWAQKNGVKNYLVYKTTRNNQPWYVLISGLYPSRTVAKQSLSALPASVQAKLPWLKPVRLAQDELKQ